MATDCDEAYYSGARVRLSDLAIYGKIKHLDIGQSAPFVQFLLLCISSIILASYPIISSLLLIQPSSFAILLARLLPGPTVTRAASL